MQTQRDHVHAHTFMVGRLSSALVEGDPTRAEIPGRRAQTGFLIGIILVVLLTGGFAVYGWLIPGGSSAYKQAGNILVEKESGNRYVYLEQALHPVPDMTSAMLILGASAKVKLISRNSLKGVPRGGALGVANAPKEVPPADALLRGPWLTCLPGSVVTGRKVSGLGVNLDPGAEYTPLPEKSFTVVRNESGVAYVLANYLKYKVADEAALVALGAGSIEPTPAPDMWLGWVGDGPDLGPARIDGAGQAGPAVGGVSHPVGTLIRQRTDSGVDQLFVLRRDGLAPMSRTEFLIADAADDAAPVDVDPAAIVGARRSADRTLLDRLPDLASLKLEETAGRAMCMRQQAYNNTDVVSVAGYAPVYASGVYADGTTSVYVPPSSGMAVVAAPVESKTIAPQVSLIAEDGTVYPLANTEATTALKLNTVTPVPFPKDLLALLPQGPVLSRQAVTGLPRG
ncbi:type VII secretion protein EccB [Actinoplanes sp. NPDC051494]|uniref:type VII secretion protein EccB n=1 Tax=Actinoplanes sp. NPDC051494 TaxID=3363907 RepID=UPI0037A3454D